MESLEQRALLSGWGDVEVRVFLPQAAASTSGDDISSSDQPPERSGWPTESDDSSGSDSAAPASGDVPTDSSDDSGSVPTDAPDGGSSDDDSNDSRSDDGGSDSSDSGSTDSGTGSTDDNSGDDPSSDNDHSGSTDSGSDNSGTDNSGSDDSSTDDSSSGDSVADDSGSQDPGSDDSGSDDSSNDAGGSTDAGSDDGGTSSSSGGTDSSGTGSNDDSGPGSGGADASGGGDSTPTDGGHHSKKDTSAPTADISVSNVHDAGDGTLNVTVVYSDNKKVKAKSIDAGDLVVSGPGGDLRVKGVTIDPGSDSKKITAVYKISAPAGSWDDADNGRYTIQLGDGAVVDSSGNTVHASSKHFDVNIAASPSDNTAPAVSIHTSDVHGNDDVKVVVHYTDDGGINLDTISGADLFVRGPGDRHVEVGVVDVDANHDHTSVTATYHLSAPGNGWDSSDNGGYSVTVNDGAVTDGNGNRSGPSEASFTANLPAPPPIDTGFGGGQGNNSGGSGGGGGNSGNPGGGTGSGGETSGGAGAGNGSGNDGTGTGGIVGTTGPINFVAESVITQSDGRILLAGHGKTVNGSDQAFLRRFNADGTLDLSFGTGGTVLGTIGESWYAVTMQGADRIVVAGTVGGDFVVNRYDLSGALDGTFGTSGQTTVDFHATTDIAYAVAIGPDNKVILAGASDGNAAFARLSADGAIDDSFGQQGLNLFDFGTASDAAAGVAVQGDGRIVAAGATDSQVAVIRLGANGEADTTFSGDGLLLVNSVAAGGAVGKVDYSQGIALAGDGKLLLANHSAAGDFAVTRIDTNGNIDSSFGDNGVRTIDMGGDDDADAIVVQETGEVLVIGTSLVAGTPKTAVAALDVDGNVITGFGDNGKLLVDADLSPGAGRELHVGDLVLRAFGARQPDGKLVIGTSNGSTSTSGPATSPLRRLIVPGSAALPQGSKIGDVGIIDGANQRLQFTDDDNSTIVLTLKGGNGSVWKNGNKINLILNDAGAGLSATFKVTGGDGRVTLGDVTVTGSLKSMKGKTADLTGVFCTTGGIGKLTVGNITGATLCAGGSIQSIAASSISGAKVLSGTALGADARLGGSGSNADQVAAAFIGSLKIAGAITDSIIGAGLDSFDGTFIDDDDRVVGGAQSLIRSISAKGGATNSHFVAGAFGSVKTPAKVDVSQDLQFQVL